MGKLKAKQSSLKVSDSTVLTGSLNRVKSNGAGQKVVYNNIRLVNTQSSVFNTLVSITIT